jgi:PAS domain S-box-containing protein
MSGGLWDAGTSITVGGHHIANWLIGQVRDHTQTDDQMRIYAHEIGADETAFLEAFQAVPSMSFERFEKIAKALFSLASQLSTTAYQNVLQARFIGERKLAVEALQESNQRLQLATDSAHLAVWDWDLLKGTMVWDERMFELYGTNREETKGTVQDWKDGLHSEDLERAITECEAAIKGGTRFDTEFRIRHKDGTVLWIKANATVLRDLEGNPVRMVGINRDVTDIHSFEEEKAKLQTQLQQSQKMESLGTLAGGVAHDMNNVLGAILGLASAHIGTQPYGSPLHKALDTICKSTERGGKMVKSLLSFARQSPIESQKLDINAILREQVSLLERTTLATVRLQLDLELELRPIQGDASALTHAFMNLCVNAVDAMPENGTLTLHTRNVDNGWIEVEVEDNGTGMPKEVLEKALDPFFTTKEIGKGTGLGLSMVFSTVKAHRGQMAIESEPGMGTRVRLRFPAIEPENQVRDAEPELPGATQASHGSRKVLLVDDDDLIQSSVLAILEVLGHTEVTTALSGEEALAILETGFEPDFIVLDMNMPGLGGAGTLPRLRSLCPAIPVLLSTGRIDQTALNLASAHPGVTLLSKPFGLRELQKHLENLGLG